mgnify:CR=1 FL=1
MDLKFIDEEWSWKNTTLFEFLKENYPRYWKEFFIEHSKELYNISEKIEENKTIIYPEINQVFRAFINIEKIKVVILGQDPYHNGSAVGLCFSVKIGNEINPSLRSIYKELENENFEVKANGDLSHWAKQGCMMLNTALTVEKGMPDDIHIGFWYDFIKDVIIYLGNRKDIAWLLMGSKAEHFAQYIEKNNNIFITSHPMPLSAYKSFRGHDAFIKSNVFTKINSFLKSKNKSPIFW